MRNLIASAVLLVVVAVSGCGAGDEDSYDALASDDAVTQQDEAAYLLQDDGEEYAAAVAPADLSGDPDDWSTQATPQR